MQSKKLIARWNNDGALYLSMKHPLHGAAMNLKLRPRIPTVIDRVWLDCVAFQAKSAQVDSETDKFAEKTISYWYDDGIPVVKEIDFSPLITPEGPVDMTPDMMESLRQIIIGGWNKEKASLLSMVPGHKRSTSLSWAVNMYTPWLKRVIAQEKLFQNRAHVIEICEATINRIRELV